MRKQQIELLEKTKFYDFAPSQIEFLKREDFTIKELQQAFSFFICNKNSDRDFVVSEAERYISFLRENRKKICNSDDYEWLLRVFLSTYHSESSKRRIFKMYLFLLKRFRENGEKCIDPVLLENYACMLQHDFPLLHRTTILREMLRDKSKRFDLIWDVDARFAVVNHNCTLIDDYKHNGKNSLLHYIAFELDILKDFHPSNKVLEELYDREKHRFVFGKEEFDNFFCLKYGSYVENKFYIALRNLRSYPVISLIYDFCANSGMKVEYDNGFIAQWKTWDLEDPDRIDDFLECYDILGQGFITKANAFHFSVKIDSRFCITIRYNKYHSVYVGAKNENNWSTNGKSRDCEIFIAPDGRLFTKTKGNKTIPLSIQSFVSLHKEKNIFADLLDVILRYYQGQNIFYKDVIADCENNGCLLPLSFNEVMKYHNRAELIQKKYKAAENISINWNKRNLNLSYLIIKSYSLVEYGISREILIQQRDSSLLDCSELFSCRTAREKCYLFLTLVILRNAGKNVPVITDEKYEEMQKTIERQLREEWGDDLDPDDFEDEVLDRLNEELSIYDFEEIADDYVDMCRQSRIKVRLDIRTYVQLNHLHDRIANDPERYRKITGKVKVPPRSKFLPLRKILPAEFEWIKTRKRLIHETEIQHHCVWSYADHITSDRCAIYSFMDSRAEHTKDGVPKRYTIEFRQGKNGKYFVQQVQGKCNKVNVNGMREYIQSFLDSQP